MENQIFELQYAMDTFYFLVCGALVMWMAAGFSMLEAGLVRSKNTTEILTKNVALYSIACFMYLACGYAIMYGGGWFLSGIEAFNLDEVLAACGQPRSAHDLLPVLFRRKLDLHQLSFAMGESIAHLHALYFQGSLRRILGEDGVYRFQRI